MSVEISTAVTALLERSLAELKHMSPEELSALPEYSDREEQYGSKTLMTAIWKKQLGDGVQIVVQAYLTKGVGSYMTADGFIVWADGSLDRISDEVRFQYC